MAAGATVLPGTHATSLRGLPYTADRTTLAPAVDTVYGLAVDSTAYREYSFVYLLNEGVARFEADGRGTRTFHQVIQILKPNAIPQWAERSFSYQPDRENFTVNWMRVVRPSGEVISEKPTQSQTSDVPASVVNPVYTETKVLRYSLSNVAAGTLVDISWTMETTKPRMPGDLLLGWNVSLPTPGLRTRFELDVPISFAPHIIEQHLDFKRTEAARDGRHVFTWAAQNVKPPKSEMFAPDSSVPFMAVRVGAPLAWSDIGRWYNGLAKDRYVLTAALTKAVDSVVRSAHTPADTLTALHRWIAKDLRYVSISLGIGGYQPRFPEATIGTGYGDCKDKATLFIAAARHLGITAYPVLLNSSGAADRNLPAIEQFNHVIAVVVRRGTPAYTFLDLTTYSYPVGEVPPSYQGAFGVVVFPDGNSRVVTFPKDSGGVLETRFVGELGTDGRVTGRLSIIPHGPAETGMRAIYLEPPDSAQRANYKRSAPRPFLGATVDTVIFFDARDRTAPPVVEFVLRDGEGAKPAGALLILSVPIVFRGLGPAFRSILEELRRADRRRLPIDPTRAVGTLGLRRELRLQLPAGWTAQLPTSLHTTGPFGTYETDYTQVGRELRIVHVLSGTTEIQPPERIDKLIEWMQTISKDDAEFVPLVRGG